MAQRLKNWTARSWACAAFLVLNVPRLRRRPVLGFFLREYRRYCPDCNLRIINKPHDFDAAARMPVDECMFTAP